MWGWGNWGCGDGHTRHHIMLSPHHPITTSPHHDIHDRILMDLDQLKQILDLVRAHELSEFEIEQEGLRLKIRKDTVGAPAVVVPAPAAAHGAPAAGGAPISSVPSVSSVPGGAPTAADGGDA